ncbi:MAG TPA: DUF484 family protein [Alphaproteobacteria bacterium]
MMTKTTTDTISADDVVEYLKSHPDFLQKHPDACDHLLPPKDNSQGRGVADFQHYMVQRLKKDKDSVIETTRDLIEVSRLNMNSVNRIHEATLKLLEARSFPQFIQAITMDIAAILDVDAAVLVVEGDNVSAATLNAAGVRVVPQGTIEQWMQGNEAMLQSDIHGSDAVFGAAARLVRSQAVLRVDISQMTPPAILAFGSRDPEMFRDGQGVELVTYLSRVVERCFRLWLDLPA